jgi:hypothetical protein
MEPEPTTNRADDEGSTSDVFDARSRFPRAEPQPSLRLVIQGSPPAPPDILPLRIARRLGLDVWGNFLLSRRVSHEMGAAGIVLLVVLTFEFLAWSLLFNVLVHAAQWALTWRTLLACLLAAVFASGVFLFERSFVTADFGESSLRKGIAYALRLGIIAGSCVATAQPLELLVFSGAIETRLRDENALAQAAHLAEELAEQEDTKARQAPELEKALAGTTADTDRRKYRDSRDHLLSEAQRLRTELEAAAKRVSNREDEVKERAGDVKKLSLQVRNEYDSERRAELQKKLDKAKNALAGAQGRLEAARSVRNSLERQLEQIQADLTVSQGSFETANRDYWNQLNALGDQETQKANKAQDKAKEMKDWVRAAQHVTPGKKLVNRRTGRSLPPKAADFTDRIRVLSDIRNGLPPTWPPVNDEVIATAVKRFGVESPAGSANGKIQERRRNAAGLFVWTYWIAFIVAAVIPLLTLAFKLMMSQELITYYSVRAQARAGNPEAILALQARGIPLESLA